MHAEQNMYSCCAAKEWNGQKDKMYAKQNTYSLVKEEQSVTSPAAEH